AFGGSPGGFGGASSFGPPAFGSTSSFGGSAIGGIGSRPTSSGTSTFGSAGLGGAAAGFGGRSPAAREREIEDLRRRVEALEAQQRGRTSRTPCMQTLSFPL